MFAVNQDPDRRFAEMIATRQAETRSSISSIAEKRWIA
jgi:hypothetical protein